MQSSAIFKYVQTYLAPGDAKHYQAKVTADRTTASGDIIKGGKHYFLCPITPSKTRISVEGKEYHIRQQHLSIYAEHQDTMLGLEAYHLTVKLMHGPSEFILHCYFDQHGNATSVMMKQGDATIELSAAAKNQFNEYAHQEVGNRIFELNQALFNKQNEFRMAIENQEKAAEEISKDLKHRLKNYLSALTQLIDSVRKLNVISNQSFIGKETILETMIAAYKAQLLATKKKKSSKRTPSSATSKISKEALHETSASSTTATETKEKNTEKELESINKELALLKGDDLTTLQNKQKLLERKLKLIPSTNFNNVIATLQQLQRLANPIVDATLNLALNGDIEAANIIVTNKYFVPLDSYFYLITNGQEAVFDILFKACPFSILLRNGRYIDTKSFNGSRRDLLTSAYYMRNERLFRKLLFTYRCNPDMIDLSGVCLLHLVAAQGEITYAEMLLQAGANLNISTKAPVEMKTCVIANPLNAIEKQEFQNESKKLYENEIAKASGIREKVLKATPLIMATQASQDKMVRLLLKHQANVNLCCDDGLNVLGRLAALQDKPLHIPTLAALVETGMSIDGINTALTVTREQSNPLHYRAQWLDEDAVHILINRFAANPNVMVRKKISVEGDTLLMNCLSVVACKSLAPETQTKATKLLRFLLDQDIRPMIKLSLDSSIQILRAQAKTLNAPRGYILPDEEILLLAQASEAALNKHEYTEFSQRSLEIIAANKCPILRAISKNMVKLDLIQAAEADLTNGDFKHCLSACETAHLQFKIKQYNERLWETWYRAYLGLGDDINAYWALSRYLDILNYKAAIVLPPEYKTEINTKIAKANTLLIEIHQRLLLKRATLTTRPAARPFTEELKQKNLARPATTATQILQSNFRLA